MYYMWLIYLLCQPCASIYVVHVVNYQKREEKAPPSPISPILITDRHMWYVCVHLPLLLSKLPFPIYSANTSAMTIIWRVNFMGTMRKNCISLSHFNNIDHRKSNLVCMCRSTSALFTTAILLNIPLNVVCHCNRFLLTWHCTTKYHLN